MITITMTDEEATATGAAIAVSLYNAARAETKRMTRTEIVELCDAYAAVARALARANGSDLSIRSAETLIERMNARAEQAMKGAR